MRMRMISIKMRRKEGRISTVKEEIEEKEK
jgi:hypothetical protein